MSVLKKLVIISGSLCLMGGSVIVYYTTYRGNNVAMLGYLMIILGWFVMLLSIGGKWLMRDEIEFKDNHVEWIKQKSLNGSIYVLFIIGLGSNWLGIEKLSYQRVNYLLNNEPVSSSTATVTGLEEKRGRNTTYYTAYISYETTSGFINQKLDNSKHLHFVGEKLNVNYSIMHPNMFYIVSKVGH